MNDREDKSIKIIKAYVLVSSGATLIPFPWVDMAVVAAAQMKMLAEISKVYEVPFIENRGKAAIFSLVGFVLPHAFAFGAIGSLLKAIPLVGVLAGTPAMALFCGAYAWALGRVFIQHFESGGTFLDFDPEAVREYFRAQFAEGRTVASTLKA